jgi:predicted cation transporter
LTWALLAILLVVFSVPFASKRAERNLELFLFAMGLLAALVSGVLNTHLAEKALVEPVRIALAVLAFGIAFHYARDHVHRGIRGILKSIPLSIFLFLMVVILGLAASAITAIIASLLLVEIITSLELSRQAEISLVVVSCFAIGLGAALTPIGEPLSTIVIAKLSGEPYHADFLFLARLLGYLVVPAVLALGVAAMFLVGARRGEGLAEKEGHETFTHVMVRAGKTYLFVMALVLLGSGFQPVIDTYVVRWGSELLYFANITSAALDNATLAAAEISPQMAALQLKSALVSLLISGGMLIPGNIPNIICAGKLRISSREWARFGVPLGLAMLAVYFVILELL